MKAFLFVVALVSFLSVAQAAEQDKQLNGRDLKEATQMNDVYARHMYSSTCMERQKALYTPKTLSEAEVAGRMKTYKESCDCLTDAVLKQFAPNDVIDYVGYMEGAFPPDVKKRAKPSTEVMQKYRGIAAVNREIKTRQQCGFKQ